MWMGSTLGSCAREARRCACNLGISADVHGYRNASIETLATAHSFVSSSVEGLNQPQDRRDESAHLAGSMTNASLPDLLYAGETVMTVEKSRADEESERG